MKKPNPLPYAAALLFAALSPGLQALPLPPADVREARALVLTEADFAKWIDANHKLRAIDFKNCIAEDDDSEDSIAAALAELEGTPGAAAAVTAAGMTSRQFVVFSFAMAEDAVASFMSQSAGGKMPEGVNPANVAFVRKHGPELQALANENESEGCGDG